MPSLGSMGSAVYNGRRCTVNISTVKILKWFNGIDSSKKWSTVPSPWMAGFNHPCHGPVTTPLVICLPCSELAPKMKAITWEIPVICRTSNA